MSISRVGFHYLTDNPEKTVEAITKAEKAAMNRPTDTAIKLLLNNSFPKGVILQYDYLVSAFPYVPNFGTSEYLCWLSFNTKKNSYAQKMGSLAVFEDESGVVSYEIEYWKASEKICEIHLDQNNFLSIDEINSLAKEMLINFFPCKPFWEYPYSHNSVENQFKYLEKLFEVPLLSPRTLEGHYKIIAESELMVIATKK